MSSFRVIPQALSDASATLSTIAPVFDDALGRLGAHAGAGDGTSGGDAVDGLLARWSAILPAHSALISGFATATASAGNEYANTDEALARDAEAGVPGR